MTTKPKFIEPEMVNIIHQKPEKSMTITMVHLPKGEFQMGSNENSNEQPIHEVIIDYEFELGKYPVTLEEYMYFVEDTERHGTKWLKARYINYKNKNNPMVSISWHDAVAYCKWLSKQTGDNYRLPTEAEWEYGCRAGTRSKWSFGKNKKQIDKYIVYGENNKGREEIVGKRLANPWGLHDMHGNIWEWCQDDWVDNYEDTPRDGKVYRSQISKSRVIRGGAWNSHALTTRSSSRSSRYPSFSDHIIGFRILRTLP